MGGSTLKCTKTGKEPVVNRRNGKMGAAEFIVALQVGGILAVVIIAAFSLVGRKKLLR
jgi:hypothetical protein